MIAAAHDLPELDGLSFRDQRDFLLEIVMRDRALRRDELSRLRDARGGRSIPRGSAITLLALLERPGRTVSHDHLSTRLEEGGHGWQTKVHLVSHIKRLRQSLARLGWPVTISTFYGTGYRADITDPAWTPPWRTEGETHDRDP
mgnify:CR=1 FL=1